MLLALVLVAACPKPPPPPPPRVDLDAEARAAAQSFLACFERSGAECRPESAPYRAFAALRLVLFLRDASPLAVSLRFPLLVRSAADDSEGRKQLVRALTRLERGGRDGNCELGALTRLDRAGNDALRRDTLGRAERLGLSATEAAGDIQALVAATAAADDGRGVEVTCRRTGLTFHLLLLMQDGAYRPVAAAETPFSVAAAVEPFQPVRIQVAGDSVAPYLPFVEEQL